MKRLWTICLCVILCLSLCGCEFYIFNTEKLLSPPELTGELKSIKNVLNEAVNGDYTLKYPTSGDIKSAVITEDIDGDGIKEAFVFYSTTDGETTQMHINVIIKDKQVYKSVDDSAVTAYEVERVDFLDLNDDGIKEIVVGYEIYVNSEKQLSVYDFSKKTLTQVFTQNYTNYSCIDIDENKKTEILIQELDTKKSVNKASVYSFSKDGVLQIAGCLMDGKVKAAEKFKLSSLSNGQIAVYVDEIKGIGAVTEVLFMQKGELKNPLLDKDNTMENIITVRSSSIASADINGDGIIEMPIESDMPCADATASEKLFYTNWCSFNGESLTVKQTSIVNVADEYSINIPKRFVENIAVSKNIEKRTREIFRYDAAKKEVKEKLISFKAMSKSEFEKGERSQGQNIRIFSKDDAVVIAEAFGSDESMMLSENEFENILSFNSF